MTRTIENDTDSDPTTVPSDSTFRLTDVAYDPATGRVAGVTETSNLVGAGYRSQAITDESCPCGAFGRPGSLLSPGKGPKGPEMAGTALTDRPTIGQNLV